ncbi:MAG: hypothetical protein LBK99_23075 [Opitutaceae bacterium]|jgi:hypothetical protein|nr:hypothetical protein [Opitutaceae bacterium]
MIFRGGESSSRIIIPKPTRSPGDYLTILFLLFWLGLWAFGEYVVTLALWSTGLRGAGWFMAAWLGGWTVGGIMAFYSVFRLVRGEPAEIVTLTSVELIHRKGKTSAYGRQSIGKIELDTSGGVHCLYIDHGADRVWLGEHIREPEREWLYEEIKEWKDA